MSDVGQDSGKASLGAECTTFTAFSWKTGFKLEQTHREVTRVIIRTESLVSPVR